MKTAAPAIAMLCLLVACQAGSQYKKQIARKLAGTYEADITVDLMSLEEKDTLQEQSPEERLAKEALGELFRESVILRLTFNDNGTGYMEVGGWLGAPLFVALVASDTTDITEDGKIKFRWLPDRTGKITIVNGDTLVAQPVDDDYTSLRLTIDIHNTSKTFTLKKVKSSQDGDTG